MKKAYASQTRLLFCIVWGKNFFKSSSAAYFHFAQLYTQSEKDKAGYTARNKIDQLFPKLQSPVVGGEGVS